ncbi:hypothetical protein SAMN05192585_12618 [Acetanaerobacterium elongatum]|uniref:Uncharacterized protein n=1 Tax=Acetanaerobacterium elongatum TaxID=258515 RepID=A0A1H0D2E3_9FIRM|nr:hypothetical protein SAMN05192585_12618 [Acetanaerobacterium elongatum]
MPQESYCPDLSLKDKENIEFSSIIAVLLRINPN